MSSYADVAARNSDQTAEEARANPVDEIVPTEPVSELIDVDQSVNVVPADFREQDVKTETQATRIEVEHDRKEAAKEVAQEKAAEEKHELKKEKNKLKREAEEKKEKAKAYAKDEKDKAKKFSQENPVVAINLVGVGLGAVLLGVFGVQKYRAGQMSWQLAGTWAAGAVGLIGLDYVATIFLNKWYNQRRN